MPFPSATPGSLCIALYPAATINSASSRLRCYGLGRELAGLGYRVSIGIDPVNFPQILFVQKVINPEVLGLARMVHDKGGLIVYDIDDYGAEALGSLKADEATFDQFIQLVSIVVVDTETRQDVFRKEPGFSHISEVWVVPDPIDYIESSTRDTPRAIKDSGQKLHACWFGNAPNIVPALPYLQELVHADNVADVSVITNANYVEYFYNNHPQFVTSAWDLNTFPGQLRSMDFCVLAHAPTLEGVQKSNNKMLAALALGVVPFVSRTPAYTETAQLMNMPELVVDSPQELLDRIKPENFTPMAQAMNSDHCNQELKKYYPSASAQLFSDMLMDYLHQH